MCFPIIYSIVVLHKHTHIYTLVCIYTIHIIYINHLYQCLYHLFIYSQGIEPLHTICFPFSFNFSPMSNYILNAHTNLSMHLYSRSYQKLILQKIVKETMEFLNYNNKLSTLFINQSQFVLRYYLQLTWFSFPSFCIIFLQNQVPVV